MYSNIVIGFDGSERAVDAVRLGGWLASATDGASVTVVDAYPYDSALDPRLVDAREQRRVRGDAERDLEYAETLLGELPSVSTRAVASYSPPHVLHDVADELGADLIVVGSTRRGVVGRITIGSVATQVVHGSPCPVAIAPHGYEPAAKGVIGAAYDGSGESLQALRAAARIASRLDETLAVISVIQLPTNPYVISMNADYIDRLCDEQRGCIDHALAQIPDLMQPVERRVRVGIPTAHLLDESAGLDLLVMGSRGYGKLRGIFLGSVSAFVSREAKCPVLLLPRSAARTGLEPASTTAAEPLADFADFAD